MSASRVGVILMQLGTPDEATPTALRRYLKEFLTDRRVIDLSPAVWYPILYGRVLRTRPAQSARLYRKIWTSDGSPLAVISKAQAHALAERLERAHPGATRVAVGMRYGNPSVAAAIAELEAAGCDRLLGVPAYPQYAGATIGSSLERLFEVLGKKRVIPAVRLMPAYFDDGAYIRALAMATADALEGWPFDHVLISFHGLPKRYVDEGDPYLSQCQATAAALIAAMGWRREQVTVVFQSRFGREEWIQPYADETLRKLAAKKIGKLAVLCPAFTADCLETLEEMGMTNREMYHAAGGGEYKLLPCLNTHPAWIDALEQLVRRELAGWL